MNRGSYIDVNVKTNRCYSQWAWVWWVNPRRKTPGRSPPRHDTRWACRCPAGAETKEKQHRHVSYDHEWILRWYFSRTLNNHPSSFNGFPSFQALILCFLVQKVNFHRQLVGSWLPAIFCLNMTLSSSHGNVVESGDCFQHCPLGSDI